MTQLSLNQAECRYGDHVALHASTLVFDSGQVIALAGPNGAGKSSLLKLCAGLAAAGAGSVELDGHDLAGLAPAERARRLAYLPADARAAWPMTARRIVALGRAPHLKPLRSLSRKDETAIENALAATRTTKLAGRAFDTLSSGERARILLARVLATGADVLILDEPTAALDPRHQLAVMEIARSAAKAGRLVLIAAHALDLIAGYADRVLLIAEGRVVADGPPAESLSEHTVRQVFGVAAPGGIQATPLAAID